MPLEDPRTPILTSEKLTHGPRMLRGPCLVLVVAGELRVRDAEGECVGASAGDLVSVAPDGCCRLECRREEGEILCFRPGRPWAQEALALAGVETRPPDRAFHVDRCGSDRARRAARILRELSLPAADARTEAGHPERLVETSRHLELLAIAAAPRSHVLEPGSRRAGPRARARRRRFLEIVERLAEAPLEDVSLQTVAEALGASERQASRLFRSELGTTFREHVASLRLERAKRLLRETELPVIEVAAEAGWSSLGHFTTTFRRRVGQTPTGYRASAGPRAA